MATKKLSFFFSRENIQAKIGGFVKLGLFQTQNSRGCGSNHRRGFLVRASYVEFRSVSTQTASPVCTGPYVTYTRNERMASGSSLIIREAILTCVTRASSDEIRFLVAFLNLTHATYDLAVKLSCDATLIISQPKMKMCRMRTSNPADRFFPREGGKDIFILQILGMRISKKKFRIISHYFLEYFKFKSCKFGFPIFS